MDFSENTDIRIPFLLRNWKKYGEQNSGVWLRNSNWGNINFIKIILLLSKYQKQALIVGSNREDGLMVLPTALRKSWISNDIYLLKVSNRNTRTKCEICSRLTIKTPERLCWRPSAVFIANFENISHLVLVLPLLTLNM